MEIWQLILSILLVLYLIDFFNLLYKDRNDLETTLLNSPSEHDKREIQKGDAAGSEAQRALNSSDEQFGNFSRISSTVDSREPLEPRPLANDTTRVGGARSDAGINTSAAGLESAENGPTGGSSASDVHSPVNSRTDVTSDENHRSQAQPGAAQNAPVADEAMQVPANTGPLGVEEVKSYYRKLATRYISTFTGGIYRQLFFDILRRRTYSLTPPGANKGAQCILFQVIDKKVYMMDPYEVPRNAKPFYRTRINEIIWMLSRLAESGRIKNTEFLLAVHDCVQTVNKPHDYRGATYKESNPTFTIVRCNFSDNIPFPMWEGNKERDGGFSGWDQFTKQYGEDPVKWEEKEAKAVFRGGNRPSMYFKKKLDADAHCHDVGRTRLVHLAKLNPQYLDASIGGKCGDERHHLNRLTAAEQHKFKYILYIEGNCMWADRLRHQVFGPSAIIKQETPCGQFFEPLLRPMTHYIPTDFFLTNTIHAIEWARGNDETVQSIVKNANEFAKNFLSLQAIEAYVEVLLDEYTKLLVEPDIKLENGAIEVTNSKV